MGHPLRSVCTVALLAVLAASASAGEKPTTERRRFTVPRPASRQMETSRQPTGLGTPAGLGAPVLPLLAQTPGTSFTSVTLDQSGVQPPDTMGAVGPTQFLTHVNGRVRVHAKANGAVGPLDVTDLTFWSTVMTGGAGNYVFGPRVRFDRLTDRWFLVIADVPANVGSTTGVANRVLVAVSDGPTIAGPASFRFFYFDQAQASAPGNAGCLVDSPTLGVDPSALYIGADVFCGPDIDNLEFANSSAFVLRKSDLLNPATPANLTTTVGAVTAFRALVSLPTGPGMLSPQGVDRPEATAGVAYFVGVDNEFLGRLVLRTVSNPGSGSPTLGPNMFVDVPATELPTPVAIPGGGVLDAFDDRLMSAELRASRLWTVHQIEVDAAGDALAGGGRNGLRWYSIDPTGPIPIATQVGTVFDPAAANPVSYWAGSLGVSGQGHMALGSTVASAVSYPGAATVGRLATDPPGATQGPPLVYQAPQGTYDVASERWGDYSMTTLDPCDDMSLWTIQEFAAQVGATQNLWGTRVVRLLAPPPSPPDGPATNIAPGQAQARVTFTGTQWYEPPLAGMSSCRRPIAVSVSGGVSVIGVTYVSPGRVDVDLSTVGTPAGLKTVTVTNPDGQAAASAVLNVTSATVIAGTKTVTGTFSPGGAITYTVTLTNAGNVAQADNPGNELVDILPATLALVSANASSGTATATPATRTVTWNGALAPGASVTITISATVDAVAPGGTVVTNQGTISYDSDGNGVNDATGLTDDPALPGSADPTSFSTPTRYYTVSPCRLVDTRGATAALGGPALLPGSRSFPLAGSCGVPPDARTLSLNVTVTSPTHQGNLRIYPAGSALPLVSTINYSPGQTRANNAIAVLSATGALAVQCDQAGGSVDLIVDVNGYFR